MPFNNKLYEADKTQYMTHYLLTPKEHAETVPYTLNSLSLFNPNQEIQYLQNTEGYITTEGATLLHLAAAAGNLDLCEKILEKTLINPFIKNKAGKTAFQIIMDNQVSERHALINLFLKNHTAIDIKGHLNSFTLRNLLVIAPVDYILPQPGHIFDTKSLREILDGKTYEIISKESLTILKLRLYQFLDANNEITEKYKLKQLPLNDFLKLQSIVDVLTTILEEPELEALPTPELFLVNDMRSIDTTQDYQPPVNMTDEDLVYTFDIVEKDQKDIEEDIQEEIEEFSGTEQVVEILIPSVNNTFQDLEGLSGEEVKHRILQAQKSHIDTLVDQLTTDYPLVDYDTLQNAQTDEAKLLKQIIDLCDANYELLMVLPANLWDKCSTIMETLFAIIGAICLIIFIPSNFLLAVYSSFVTQNITLGVILFCFGGSLAAGLFLAALTAGPIAGLATLGLIVLDYFFPEQNLLEKFTKTAAKKNFYSELFDQWSAVYPVKEEKEKLSSLAIYQWCTARYSNIQPQVGQAKLLTQAKGVCMYTLPPAGMSYKGPCIKNANNRPVSI